MKKNVFTKQITPKYKKELANELGYSLSTFQRRLKNMQIEIPRGLIPPDQQEIILRNFGWKVDDLK